ncbi:MAG: hypothetical protein O2832_00665 [Proteobacteria bacterium]|jgi:hypothetical protein|nr:hypothetical protein [Pseudomonadota bacterium]
MKFIVTGMNIVRLKDGYVPKMNDDNFSCWTRDEIIDTEENEMFADCRTPYEVEDRYETFWNRLNDNYENSEIVKVLNVREVA